jgi:hypothetical protein
MKIRHRPWLYASLVTVSPKGAALARPRRMNHPGLTRLGIFWRLIILPLSVITSSPTLRFEGFLFPLPGQALGWRYLPLLQCKTRFDFIPPKKMFKLIIANELQTMCSLTGVAWTTTIASSSYTARCHTAPAPPSRSGPYCRRRRRGADTPYS